MKNKSIFASLFTLVFAAPLFAAGLPKQSIQVLVKALQDPQVEVRTAAAQALAAASDDAEPAVKVLESSLISSTEVAEQAALAQALIAIGDSGTPKRLADALANPQFSWGPGAKPKAVEVIGKMGQKKMIKWLTDLLAGEQEPPVRAAAARMLGEIGAPPKKEKKD